MKVIGLTGVARSGKDTVAGLIIDELAPEGGAYSREGFADKLKMSVFAALGMGSDRGAAVAFADWLKTEARVEVWTGGGSPVVGLSGREFLQNYGTEAHRDLFGADFWVDALLPYSEGAEIVEGSGCIRDDCDVLVIPDVRFENEARRVLDYGGEVWRVTRPGVDAVNGHASEAGIPDHLVTREVGNLGGLGYLRGVVRYALREARIA